MRTAGLKNITTRHISLTAQSLGIVIHLIPHLKTILQKKSNENQIALLSNFDRLLKVHPN